MLPGTDTHRYALLTKRCENMTWRDGPQDKGIHCQSNRCPADGLSGIPGTRDPAFLGPFPHDGRTELTHVRRPSSVESVNTLPLLPV